MATIGQFDPDPLSASDLQGDLIARLFGSRTETIPNLIGRKVTFFHDANNKFDGDVIDHQGNEITISYTIDHSIAFALYRVSIAGDFGSNSGAIHGNEPIKLDP